MRLGSLMTVLFVGCMLYADVMYEMTLTTTPTSELLGGTEVSKRVFIKGEAARVEETLFHPDSGEHIRITIYRFDRGLVWTLDMDDKHYTETALKDTVRLSGDIGESEPLFEAPEITVQKTGAAKDILGKECEEVMVSIVEKSDSVKTELKRTMWVTQELDGYEELIAFYGKREEAGRLLPGTGTIMDQATSERLPEHMHAIEGFPLECHDLLTMSCKGTDVCLQTNYLFTKLDDMPINQMVFETPHGFTLQE
jgi:hypothetical protein